MIAVAVAVACVLLLATAAVLVSIRGHRRRRPAKLLEEAIGQLQAEIGRELAPALERLGADLTEWMRENEP